MTIEQKTELARILTEKEMPFDSVWVNDPDLGEIYSPEAQSIFNDYYDLISNVVDTTN